MVYQILSKMFTDMDAFVYVKQRKAMQNGHVVFFDIHEHFLGPDHVARQAACAEGKLQNSHCNGGRNTWDWDKYVALHKEQHAIMESLADYGYSGMDNGTKVHHFLQGIKSPELKVAVNVVYFQTEKYGTDCDATMSYLGRMVAKKGLILQYVGIAKTQSQQVRPKVAAFMGKYNVRNTPRQS